jgi:hypothetical protein
VIHAALVGVALQPHPPGDKPRDALKHSLACPPALDIDHNIIGEADKAEAAPFKLFI